MNKKRVKEIFLDSYWRAVLAPGMDQKFYRQFYEDFLASSESARAHFKDTDWIRQRSMLSQAMIRLLFYFETGEVDDFLRKMAKMHGRGGTAVAAEQYDVFMDCLIRAVKKYDADFNDEIEQAWRTVLGAGIDYMKAESA